MYLGGGSWAPNCYTHATATDRDRFRQHEQDIATTRDDDYRERTELMCELGRALMVVWVDHHDEASKIRQAAAAKSGSQQRG